MSILVGYAILAMVMASIFALLVSSYGVIQTLALFVVSIAVTALIVLGVWLIAS